MNRPRSHKGMSLVETLVAVAIMSVLALTVTSMAVSMLKSERRNRAISEVVYQGNTLMAEITQGIRSASFISSPATGTSATTLQLVLAGIPSMSPMKFSTSSALVLMSAGSGAISGATTTLSASTTVVSSLIFTNVSAVGTDGAVRVALTVSSKDASVPYSSTIISTVTLR